jgi:MFS family permease
MNVDVGQSFQNLLDTVIRVIPQILLFLVILLVGWLIAKALEKATDAVLERLGFDRMVERGGIRRAMTNSGYDPSSIAAKLVYLAVLLFTLQLAFGVFGPNPVSALLAGIVAWLPQAFVGIVIVVVAAYVAGVVREIIRGALGGTTYGSILATVVFAFILGIGIIAALAQIGVAVAVTGPILFAVLATVAGVIVVGVGGGLVRPMQQRWERMLNTAEDDMVDLRQQREREGVAVGGAGYRETDSVGTGAREAGDTTGLYGTGSSSGMSPSVPPNEPPR